MGGGLEEVHGDVGVDRAEFDEDVEDVDLVAALVAFEGGVCGATEVVAVGESALEEDASDGSIAVGQHRRRSAGGGWCVRVHGIRWRGSCRGAGGGVVFAGSTVRGGKELE